LLVFKLQFFFLSSGISHIELELILCATERGIIGILKLVLGVAALLGGIYLVSKVYYEIRGRSSTPQS